MKNVKKIVAFVIAAALVATGYASLDDVAGMLGEPEAKIADTIAEGEMKVTGRLHADPGRRTEHGDGCGQ